MARKKRYKPPLQALCKLGTIAHNRPFTTRDLREYTGEGVQLVRWLKRNKLVRPIASDRDPATGAAAKRQRTYPLYPTAKGWNMIEKACKVR